jgi:FtsZ-interacting cell division protein ZipA
MSDLQISLLGIGAVVIAGVLLYNSYQQRRLRQRLDQAFGEPRQDVLLGEGAQSAATARVEPQLDAVHGQHEVTDTVARPAIASGAPPAVANIDEAIDCVATLSSDTPLTSAQVAEILSGVAACGRSWRAAGFNAGSGRWEEVNRAVTGHYTRLRLALQMANRGGPLSAAQLGIFGDSLNALATRFSASIHFPDTDKVLADAQALDAFCVEVDVTIGINVITADGEGFSGGHVRALVESEGFKLEPDGVFHLEDANEHTLLTISNQEAVPFLPEAVNGMNTHGITILLDVPRVADADHALQRMFELGRSLSVTLKGRLVDDNRATLTAASMDKIRQQLKDIHLAMNVRDVTPGSARALRLFS